MGGGSWLWSVVSALGSSLGFHTVFGFDFLEGKNTVLFPADEAGWGVIHEIRSGRRAVWACTHK